MTYSKIRTCQACKADYEATDRWSRTCPMCKQNKADQDAFEKREAPPHSTREAKDIITPLSLSTLTRESHPHLWFSPQRHGARPKVWPRRACYMPCELCNRVLTDTSSQAVVCYRTGEDVVYLRCRACLGRYTMEREKRK